MLTLPQWQNTRRVDHANLGKFHPRFRVFDPNQRPDLKVFDHFVRDYSAPNTTKLDQVTILGDILGGAADFLRSNKYEAHRYLDAVQTLRTAAVQELRDKFPGKWVELQNDIERAAKGQPLSSKTIPINVYYLDKVGATPNLNGIDKIINDQINNANNSGAFKKAELQIARTNPNATLISKAPNDKPILESNGKLQEARNGGGRLIETLNASRHEGVDVVFLEEYDSPDVQGFTFQVSKKYDNNISSTGPSDVISPARPIVTLRTKPVKNGEKTHPTTLLHEICHAISGNGSHSQDRDNLMADGAKRTGKNALSWGQIGQYRNNDCVKGKDKG